MAMPISPTDYSAIYRASAENWSQVIQDPTYKALIDSGVIYAGQNQGEQGAETLIDWNKMPAMTGGLSPQQLQQMGGKGLHFEPIGQGGFTGNLLNSNLKFNDPNYGQLTIAGNTQDPKEGAFWSIAPMIPLLAAGFAGGGLTWLQQLEAKLPNIAGMFGNMGKQG